ncbi:MAG: mechanosensitive ion channel family protein [Alkalilacustris sp.]
MEQEIAEAALGFWREVEVFLRDAATPWRLYQIGILLGLFVAAHGVRRAVAPRLDDWLRAREGWPRWRLRLAVMVTRRVRGLAFVALAWAVVGVLEAAGMAVAGDLLGLGATIATAWMAVGFAGQVIRNRPLRRIATWGAWIYVALLYLGLLDGALAFLDSVAVGFDEGRISALSVLKAAVVTGALVLIARGLMGAAVRRLQRSPDVSPSMRVLATKALQLVVFGAAIAVGLRALGVDLTGLAVLSGAIGLGIGFGLQKVVSNLVSGVVILLDKSVKPGDVISLGDTFGWINELGARYVSVLTRDGREYLIPNEDFVTGQVVNWSHSDEFVRIDLTFGTSYGDDPHKVRQVAVEAAARVPRVLPDRPIACHITGFGDSSVDYVLRVWIRDAQDGLASIRGAIFLALWDAFKAQGITIPFPQRDVRVQAAPAEG